MGAPAMGNAWPNKQLAKCGYRNNISLYNSVMDTIKHFRDLHVYQGGKALIMEIFEVSKTFPVEERFDDACDKIITLIVKMIDQPDKWVIKVPSKVRRRA